MGRHRSRSLSSSSSGRGIQSSSWDGESGYRVHVSDLAAGVSKKEIERVFRKHGTINEIWVATNPPCFAFVNFKHRSDAEKAIEEVDGKAVGSSRVGVSWARTRTYGGRNRGSRGAPYGSYRSNGGRRRSRSRSRSGSRHRRNRRSRSRSDSRDRRRRRSSTPTDRKRSSQRSTDERREGRRRSKSRTRSRSKSKDHSPTRRDSPENQNQKNISRGSSVDDRHRNEINDSPKDSNRNENNHVDDRSPSATGDGDSNQ